MFTAREGELRLALLSLFVVATEVPGLDQGLCREVVDRAAAEASTASASVLKAFGEDATATRFGAARVLNSLCAACRGCSRGVGAEDEVTAAAPR